MNEEPILWVLEFEGGVFDIHLFPDGQAFASIVPGSPSQATGTGLERILSQVFPPEGEPNGKFIQGKYPLFVPDPLAEKMRQVAKIEDPEENVAARGPIDAALMALFVTEVVPRIRRQD